MIVTSEIGAKLPINFLNLSLGDVEGMEKQREKNRFVIDKNRSYEYSIAIIILDELCNEGIIDIFDMAEALIKLRKLYNLPVIDIYDKKRK